jgi:type II secretory pathway component PulF
VTNKLTAIIIFVIGIFFMLMHTILPYLWSAFGITAAYPLIWTDGILMFLPAFSPPIGALLLIIAGLVYGRKSKEVTA